MIQEPPLMSQVDASFRPIFYADKRRYASWIGGVFILIFTGDIFFGILAQVLTSLAIDWWFFSFKKKRESDLADKSFMMAKSMTRSQIDNFANLFVMTRRVAFIWSYIIGLAAYLYSWEIGYKLAFMMSIISINLAVCVYCLLKKIISPYEEFKDEDIPYEFSKMTVPAIRRASHWDERESLTSISNLLGVTNPCSPNYMGIRPYDK